MAQKRERAAPRQRSALTRNTKSLDSFDVINTAAEASRQVPIGAIRLASRFGLSLSAATAIAEANLWGAA